VVVIGVEPGLVDIEGLGTVDVGDVQDFPWGRFVFFKDPDGNGWAVQQIVYPS